MNFNNSGLETNKIEEIKTPENKIKEGVDFVFEQNPELFQIGTKEQYSEYLNTVFSESKLKNILFHATRENFDEFDRSYISKGNLSFGEGFYFTDKIENHKNFRLADKLMSVIINSHHIYNDSSEARDKREKPKYNPYVNSHERLLEVQDNHNKFLENNFDTVIANHMNKNEFVVFDPNNIHILGSRKDIEQFKEFVSKENKK